MQEKLLIHCCCAPCASGSIERLIDEGYDITLYYDNSNIYPESEFIKRKEELYKLAKHYNLVLIESPYNHKSWKDAVKGFEDEKEGGKRCSLCFDYNIQKSFLAAKELGFKHFTTTLTISPYKSSIEIFRVGENYEGFLSINLKKKDGYKKSIEKSKELGLYRQDYCGCEFSLKAKVKS